MFQLSDFDLTLTDGVLLGLLIPVCFYLAFRLYRPGGGGGRWRRWLLGLRGLGLLLLLVLMMEPILALTAHTQRRPLVAVLVDNSESMRVEEDGRTRQEIALAVLKGGALENLRDRARVSRFWFSDTLAPFSAAGADTLGFDGRASDIAGALDGVREHTAGAGLAAVVLVSDGVHNLGGRPERAASEVGAPVYAVGVGDPQPPNDLALASAVIDPMGYVGQELSLSVSVKTSGYEGGQALLEVRRDGRRVAEQPVLLSDGEQTIQFMLRPEQAGRHVYRVAIPPQPGERSTDNNTMMVSAEVLESRVRVLLAAGRPSADLAYFQRLLKADSNLDVEMVVATRPGEWSYRMQEALAQPEGRDLVVLFDVPGAILSGDPERKLVAFVRSGGGVLVVGGTDGLGEGYARSGLADVLPLLLPAGGAPYRMEPFQVALPASAYRHPVLRVSEDPLSDRARWEELPPLLAYNQTAGARTGAVVLLEHATVRSGGANMPLAAVMRIGAGKSMAVAFRSFWRFGLMMWGIGKTDAVSRAFWTQAVRWLITKEDVARVRASVDRPVYRSGEPVTVHARVFDELLQPQEGAQVTVAVADSSGMRNVVLQDQGDGRYSGSVGGFPQGDYGFEVRAVKGGEDLGEGTGRFTVGRYSLEYEEVRMNAGLLQEVAARSGGMLTSPDSLGAALEKLALSPQPVTVQYRSRLWGKTWPLVVLVALLTVEWTVRRRRGMV